MNLHQLKEEIPEIFEKVKRDVRKVLGKHRAGLSLGLVEMESFQGILIGGMHYYPGPEIVMNKVPLRIILKSQPYEIVWAYTYHILLHEYIHSLGIIDEYQCREITLRVTQEIFEESDHPAMILAKNGIGVFIPNLEIKDKPPEWKLNKIPIEYVYGFDRESQDYFS